MKYRYLSLLVVFFTATSFAAIWPTIKPSSPTSAAPSATAPAAAAPAPVAAPTPVTATAPPPPDQTPGAASYVVPSFVGVYRCHGTDPYLNKDYTGTVKVTQQNTVYRLEMDYDTGEKSIGTGGLYDKYLMSVVFQDTTDPKHIGLEQYHFTPDYKTMSGYWVYLGKDKLGKEICEKQS